MNWILRRCLEDTQRLSTSEESTESDRLWQVESLLSANIFQGRMG
jgi:hypothetical protein